MYSNPIYKRPLLSPERLKQQQDLLKEQNELKKESQNNLQNQQGLRRISEHKAQQEETKSNSSFFDSLHLLSEYIGYESEIIKADNDNPVEMLMVQIADSEELPVIAQIFFMTDFLKDDSEDGLVNLQLVTNLPVAISDDKFAGVAVILARLAPFISIGHFAINPEGRLYYAHSITGSGKNSIDLPSFAYIFEVMASYIPFIASFIKQYTEDQIDIDSCLKKILEKFI